MPFLRSTDEQLQDARDSTDDGWTVVHIDTCLGSYLQDHHNRDGELLLGTYVTGSNTVGEVLDGLEDEFRNVGWQLGEDRKGYDHDKAQATLAKLREDNADRLDRIFDTSRWRFSTMTRSRRPTRFLKLGS
jgi:hypothetical protein